MAKQTKIQHTIAITTRKVTLKIKKKLAKKATSKK